MERRAGVIFSRDGEKNAEDVDKMAESVEVDCADALPSK